MNNGDKIAAEFISSELKKFSTKSFLFETYQQPFPLAVNTFPKVNVAFEKNVLTAGKDFLLSPFSSGIKKGNYKIYTLNKAIIESEVQFAEFQKQNFSNSFILIDTSGISDPVKLNLMESITYNSLNSKGVIIIKDEKLTNSLSPRALDFVSLEILRSSLPSVFKKISIEVENKFYEKYFTQNVVAFVEGNQFPDSFIVFSAHYDHLGRMGQETFFPGANDNASGTAMLLRLAEYFSKNPQKLSIAFIAFGAEEAGLVGSKYFTQHPLFPLEKVLFLTNLDILGTGDEGITVVNAPENQAEFDMLKKINAEKNLLPAIKERTNAKNSDHYYFAEKGVPSFFIYTLGGIKAYHDIYDRPETLPLTEFEDIFKLLKEFVISLQR